MRRREFLVSLFALFIGQSCARSTINKPKILNDSSKLNPVPVAQHIILPQNNRRNQIADLRRILKNASAQQPISIGAARHSQGAHSLARNGYACEFVSEGEVEIGEETYRVPAGMRWRDLLPILHQRNLSPKVMQSNHNFGIGATFSVNAHGWPVPFGPMGSTVKSVEVLLADGELIEASLTKNAEIFKHLQGGYGLGGLILNLEIEHTPNQNLKPHYQALPAQNLAPEFLSTVRNPTVEMAYGRLNVDRERFFEHGFIVSYKNSETNTEIEPLERGSHVSSFAREIFHRQVENDWVKRQRWLLETRISPSFLDKEINRNELLHTDVADYLGTGKGRTDIIHEYFIPPENFAEFLEICKKFIPTSQQELLNVTLRFVEKDRNAKLRYAQGDVIAAVMFFSQKMDNENEKDMRNMTQNLISGVLELRGNYYLPYRPHATSEQFLRAYPNAPEFASFKRELDPDNKFNTEFWKHYFTKL